MPALPKVSGTVPGPDPTAEAVRCLTSAFPRSKISLAGGNIVAGNVTLATAAEIAAKSLQAIVVAAGARLKAAEQAQNAGA